jgi:transcriptional regulator with XRE-family HTH domain
MNTESSPAFLDGSSEIPEFLTEIPFDISAEEGEGVRTKTSLRMHYDAQAAVIERQLDGLEGVRSKLGLSQRKMAQLLMVDPSAWTRWNRPGNRAPGIVWRSLQWYMILQEKIPGLTPNYFLAAAPSVVQAEALKGIRRESEAREVLEGKLKELDRSVAAFNSEINAENGRLLKRLSHLEGQLRMWRVGTVILTLTLLFSTFIWVYLRNRA